MQNKPLRASAYAVTNAAANALNPPTITGGVGTTETKTYILLTHIRIVNKTGVSHTITAYIGATGGSATGTEFAFNGATVGAQSYIDWYGRRYLSTADFLTMLADANTALVANFEGEIGCAD